MRYDFLTTKYLTTNNTYNDVLSIITTRQYLPAI